MFQKGHSLFFSGGHQTWHDTCYFTLPIPSSNFMTICISTFYLLMLTFLIWKNRKKKLYLLLATVHTFIMLKQPPLFQPTKYHSFRGLSSFHNWKSVGQQSAACPFLTNIYWRVSEIFSGVIFPRVRPSWVSSWGISDHLSVTSWPSTWLHPSPSSSLSFSLSGPRTGTRPQVSSS